MEEPRFISPWRRRLAWRSARRDALCGAAEASRALQKLEHTRAHRTTSRCIGNGCLGTNSLPVDQRSQLELLLGWADGQTDGLPPVRRALSAPGRRLCHRPRAPQTCCRRLGPRRAGVVRAPLPASCCSCSSCNSKQQVDSARCPAAAAQAAESARAGAGGTQARAPLAPPALLPRACPGPPPRHATPPPHSPAVQSLLHSLVHPEIPKGWPRGPCAFVNCFGTVPKPGNATQVALIWERSCSAPACMGQHMSRASLASWSAAWNTQLGPLMSTPWVLYLELKDAPTTLALVRPPTAALFLYSLKLWFVSL